MDDGVHVTARQQVLDQRLVAEIADHQLDLGRHGRAAAGREIVEHDDFLARVQQFQHHVGADIAGAAGHEDSHVVFLAVTPWEWTKETLTKIRGRPFQVSLAQPGRKC